MTAKTQLHRDPSTKALADHVEKRMSELRLILEDECLDEKPIMAVSTRARLNELKELFDLFELPTA